MKDPLNWTWWYKHVERPVLNWRDTWLPHHFSHVDLNRHGSNGPIGIYRRGWRWKGHEFLVREDPTK